MLRFQGEIKKLTAIVIWMLLSVLIFSTCKKTETKELEVVASAYNSLPGQTHNDHPNIGAWGDTLRPGMKAIAVSHDLIKQGLTRNQLVKIEGLPGKYRVLDKMNRRWKQKIDIYMGVNQERAEKWGIQEVTIRWKVEKDSEK
jgi:3D (Asp-Asp-Asp) domain-containing protein